MQGYNVIIVFDKAEEKMLMCKRRKEPYMGKYSLTGGKIEPNENGLESAYRELFEETNISIADITLHRLMDFTYYYLNCYVEVYAGKLKSDVQVYGDENELFWSDLNHDYFDLNYYAGEGNIGHMIEQVKKCREEIFNNHA